MLDTSGWGSRYVCNACESRVKYAEFNNVVTELKNRIEQLEKSNTELKKQIKNKISFSPWYKSF